MSAPPEILALAMKSLPHGREFRFVDRMISLTQAKKAWANITSAATNIICAAICRANRFCPAYYWWNLLRRLPAWWLRRLANPRWPKLKLAALRAVKILGSVRPGQTLRIEAAITGQLNSMIQASATAFVGDAKVLSAEILLSGNDNPQPK